MSLSIERSRNSCALHGALQTLQAVGGIVPIIHSTSGCGLQQYLGGNRVSGCNGSGRVGGLATPSTNVIERQVVFGGTSRLREQIKNTVKVVNGDLYVVLSGCATELVGDDIPAMAKEAREQGFPVIDIPTPGFRGDVHSGYLLAVKGLIEQISSLHNLSTQKQANLVNVFGIIPGQDVYWQGNLDALKRTLGLLGLKVNTLFGFDQSIDDWKKIPQAALNISFSPWGTEIVKYLAEKYGTTYLEYPSLPVGSDQTNQLLHAVGEKLRFAGDRIAEVEQRETRKFTYQLERVADVYFEHDLQKEFALVGESWAVAGIGEFLVRSLGLIPKLFVITDNPPETNSGYLKEGLKRLLPEAKAKIFFAEDAGEISDIIKNAEVELILGSSLEAGVARELNVPLQLVSFPIKERVVLNKSYIGYDGAIALLEDLGNAVLA